MPFTPRTDVMSVVAFPESGWLRSRAHPTGDPRCPGQGLEARPAPPCESHLHGDRKQKKLVYQTDAKTGQTVRQERVADADPMWSSTPDTVPLTPDEDRTNTTRPERGRMQIEMLQALAALRSTGIEVPPEAMWLLEREIPAGVLRGTVVCANGTTSPAGSNSAASAASPWQPGAPSPPPRGA